jgi:hydrogenase/urease accessory protein HupE
MKNLIAILALTTAAAHAHPGHPGHESGDIGWGSHPILGLAFVALLTAAVFISRRTPRILAGLSAVLAAVTLILVR